MRHHRWHYIFSFLFLAFFTSAQDPCIAPDDGTGTVNLPPEGCPYLSADELHMIIDGLPAGTEITVSAIHQEFFCPGGGNHCGTPGGSLGGETEQFQSILVLEMRGTGELEGFQRTISLPAGVETHTGPRDPASPVQSFATEMFQLQGVLPPGDPDFQGLQIIAGTNFGLPSPGHTTLIRNEAGDFQVDSFFDISYAIDFVGEVGGRLDGLAGITMGTVRMGPPSGVTVPRNGPCIVDDNGLGTVNLPPPCPYIGPPIPPTINDLHGLPPGSTIEVVVVHQDFVCPGPVCGTPGGTLGGSVETFDSNLLLNFRGTGDFAGFSRLLVVPVNTEVHTGPVVPGSRVQDFPTEMFRLEGEIFGDPDFDSLRITAGADFGMPSPGHATLTRLPDNTFNVDSFFDIDFQIQFEGAPGSILSGVTSSAQLSHRMGTGENPPPPPTGPCELPDDGTGTVNLPPDCPYVSQESETVRLGTLRGVGGDINVFVVHESFDCLDDPEHCGIPGGSLGGETEDFNSALIFSLVGTGALEHYSRTLVVPTLVETHTAPRTPGQPVQSFSTRMFRLDGQITDDPDFNLFRVTAGDDFGLPSPGRTTLTQLPGGGFNVDSFFDITYNIEYDATASGPLMGISGNTVAKHRVNTGERRVHHQPCCPPTINGAINLPPVECEYLSPDEVHMIIDGLPPGATIELDASHEQFICQNPDPDGLCGEPGGTLGGRREVFDSIGRLQFKGIGVDLLCLIRELEIPLLVETHSGPMSSMVDTEIVALDLRAMAGELPPGDPDFAVLSMTGGTANGLDSPGRAMLTRLPDDTFVVDSFFDITYQINFEGAVGGILEGMAGTTEANIRMQVGDRKPFRKQAPFWPTQLSILKFVPVVNTLDELSRSR